MASLVSDDENNEYISAMNDLHDTFAKPIVIFYTAQKVVVSTNPNHNMFYSAGPNQTQTIETPVKVETTARIHYRDESKLDDLLLRGGTTSSDQINVKKKDWRVKLVVNEEVKNILLKAKRVQFDDYTYEVDSDCMPRGVITFQFFDIYLKALQ